MDTNQPSTSRQRKPRFPGKAFGSTAQTYFRLSCPRRWSFQRRKTRLYTASYVVVDSSLRQEGSNVQTAPRRCSEKDTSLESVHHLMQIGYRNDSNKLGRNLVESTRFSSSRNPLTPPPPFPPSVEFLRAQSARQTSPRESTDQIGQTFGILENNAPPPT